MWFAGYTHGPKLRFARIPPRESYPLDTGQPRRYDGEKQIKGMRGSEEALYFDILKFMFL